MSTTLRTAPRPSLINRDGAGNALIYTTYKNGNATIELKLLTESRRRLIGSIDVQERVLYVTRKRVKHLHLKSKSYGFNDAVLRTPPVEVDTVIITDEEGSYQIPRTDLIKEGQYLHFKDTGFEKQIFVSLETLKKYVV